LREWIYRDEGKHELAQSLTNLAKNNPTLFVRLLKQIID
jgi:hypothetical protein